MREDKYFYEVKYDFTKNKRVNKTNCGKIRINFYFKFGGNKKMNWTPSDVIALVSLIGVLFKPTLEFIINYIIKPLYNSIIETKKKKQIFYQQSEDLYKYLHTTPFGKFILSIKTNQTETLTYEDIYKQKIDTSLWNAFLENNIENYPDALRLLIGYSFLSIKKVYDDKEDKNLFLVTVLKPLEIKTFYTSFWQVYKEYNIFQKELYKIK